MKKTFTKIFLATAAFAVLGTTSFAQIDADFETVGQDWDWFIFDNAEHEVNGLEVVANPDKSGINTSDDVVKFITSINGAEWAGAKTADFGSFTVDEDNCLITIQVYKEIISGFTLKFEGAPEGDFEIKITNTKVNEWEELTFNFYDYIGRTPTHLVVIPDHRGGRDAEVITYFDNITYSAGQLIILPEPQTLADEPTVNESNVISIFSSTKYANLPGVDYYPDWGQATQFALFNVAGEEVLQYKNLNYQGIEFADQDVTGYDNVNIDIWTADETKVEFFLIANGAGERLVLLDNLVAEEWNTFSIPLSSYSDQGLQLSNIWQFKLVGTGGKTIYVDNLYFAKDTGVGINNTSASDQVSLTNPVSKDLTVTAADVIQEVVVVDISGSTVALSSANSSEVSLDLSGLSSGIYIVKVKLANGKTTVSKIVKL